MCSLTLVNYRFIITSNNNDIISRADPETQLPGGGGGHNIESQRNERGRV
jgi:hypothetical protein